MSFPIHRLVTATAGLSAALLACTPAPKPAPDPPETASSAGASAATPAPSAAAVAGCPGGAAERVDVAAGGEARAKMGVGVAFQGTEHDNYGNGRTDLILRLSLHGIMDDGSLTPSAMTWRPSAFAKPRWTPFRAMRLCARVVSASEQKVTLELARLE